jgi:hypothetical protein
MRLRLTTGGVSLLVRVGFDRGEAPSELSLNRMLLVERRSPQQETFMRHFIKNNLVRKQKGDI